MMTIKAKSVKPIPRTVNEREFTEQLIEAQAIQNAGLLLAKIVSAQIEESLNSGTPWAGQSFLIFNILPLCSFVSFFPVHMC